MESYTATPYGMTNSATGGRPALPFLRHVGGNVPAWGLVSSVDQMAVYLKWLLATARGVPNPVLDPAAFRMMLTPVIRDAMKPEIAWGLGFELINVQGGGIRPQHGGTFPGYRSLLIFDPAMDFGVIVMGNVIDLNRDAYSNLAFQILGTAVTGHPVPTQVSTPTIPLAPVLSSTPSPFDGVYDDLYEHFRIATRQDGSMYLDNGGFQMSLTPQGASRGPFGPIQFFRIGPEGGFSAWTGEKIAIELGADGKPVCALVANGYRTIPVSRPFSARSILCP